MNNLITDQDFEMLRNNHFLSKNLTIYLKSILNREKIPFDYKKTIGIRHRLKNKATCAKIFLEICKNAEITKIIHEKIFIKIVGDKSNINEFLNIFEITDQSEILKSDKSDNIGVKFYEKKLEIKEFYYNERFYNIIFWIIDSNPEYSDYLKIYLDNADKIVFIPGSNYSINRLKMDLEKIHNLRQIPKILLLKNDLMVNVDDIVKQNDLKIIDFNIFSLKSFNNLKALLF